MNWAAVFWIGFFILLLAHFQLLVDHMRTTTRQHALIGLTGTVMMFVGSKIGREFLGIKA